MKIHIGLLGILVLMNGLWAREYFTVTETNWIAYPEAFEKGIEKQRFFRKEVTVREGLVSAKAWHWLDDTGTIYIDGVAEPPGTVSLEGGHDMTDRLKAPGRHLLAIMDINKAASGGVVFRLELTYRDGHAEQVVSDASWRCSQAGPDGWNTLDFNDKDWPAAMAFGNALAAPWSGIRDMTALLTPNDKARYEAWKRKDRELAVGILERLSHERKPSCRIVYERGKPMFDIGGRLYETMYYNTSENWNNHNFKLKEQVGYFRDAGIHVYGIGYKTADIWKPDGSIDFQKVYDRLLDALMDDPDAYFMYCIATDNPPKWWCKAHPEEITGYANGTPDFECNVEIKNIAAPSMASKLWMKDVADFQRRMVEWLEASPFASRIFAYRTDYGVHHEWHYYGMTEYMPDNSLPMTIAFRNWLRENYKDDVSALRRAWHDETVAFETANVPPPADRNRTSAGILRDPAKDRPSVDYQRCHAQVVRICLLNSNRTIKEACGHRALVGNYCGYFFGMSFPAEGWHLENERLLDSPYVDFQCSPHIYGNESRAVGEPQQARCLLETFRRRGNKLAILEADNQPHNFKGTYCHYAWTPQQSRAILSRDFVQSLAWGCGYWYFDFAQGWYADPMYADFMKQLFAIRTMKEDCASVAEIAFVGDYESVMFTNVTGQGRELSVLITSAQVREFVHAGVPFDTYSFADLASGNIRDYKLYFFPNLFYLTPEKRAVIEKLKAAGKMVVFLYAPGYLTADGASVESMSALTGMKIRQDNRLFESLTTLSETGDVMKSYVVCQFSPLFRIEDPAARPLGTLKLSDGEAVTYAAKGPVRLCTTGFLSRQALRGLFAEAGIHVYTDDTAVSLYANKSWVAVHSAAAGRQRLHLPRKASVTMMYPQQKKIGEGLKTIEFDVPQSSTTLFLIKEE